MGKCLDGTSFLSKMVAGIKSFVVKYKVPFFTALTVGALTHMFAFTNKLINHDEVGHMFDKGGTMVLGRWGLDLLSYIFPDFSMPWIYGIISIVLLAFAACFIVKIFDIKNKVLQALLAGLVLSFPSLTATFTYMFTVSSYALAFLLAVVSVDFFISKSVVKKVLAFIMLIFSLSIYQSYITIAASFLVMVIIQKLIKKDNRFIDIVKEGALYIAFLVVSLGVYYGITQLLLSILQTSFNSYANNNMGFSLSTIFSQAVLAYKQFINVFRGAYGLIPLRFSKWVHAVCVLAVGISLFVIWLKRRATEKVLLPMMLVLFPLSVNCIFLFTSETAIHTLVMYGFTAVYVLATIVIDHIAENVDFSGIKGKSRWIVREIVTIGMALVVAVNIYVGNEVYLKLHLRYENAHAFYTSMMTRVAEHEDFDENCTVALVGKSYEFYNYHGEFYDLRHIMGSDGFTVNDYTRELFVQTYVGFDVKFASSDETLKIREMDDFEEMAIYPYNGSVKRIGDYMVVRLS